MEFYCIIATEFDPFNSLTFEIVEIDEKVIVFISNLEKFLNSRIIKFC